MALVAALIVPLGFTGSTGDFVPLIFAHRALAAAEIFALAAALIVRFPFAAALVPLIFAHRALAAAEIFALAAALIVRFPFAAAPR